MEALLVIFSKDRPFQLDCLLRSITLRLGNLFSKIVVQYTYTEEKYNKGYDLLKLRFPNVVFDKEDLFWGSLINILSTYKNYDLLSFMVDDDYIYNDLSVSKDRLLKSITEDDICFSLRLGLNCTYSHPANKFFRIASYIEYDGILKTNFKQQEYDFAYPMSLDGHIFRYDQIFNIIRVLKGIINPNTLEEKMNLIKYHVKENNIVFLRESLLVGNPVNLVNNTHNNRNGLIHNQSVEDLNNLYLDGYVCDIKELELDKVNGCHQEFKYNKLIRDSEILNK